MVPDGATMVIGGLIENDDSSSMQGIYGASRLPVVGPLFRQRQQTAVKREPDHPVDVPDLEPRCEQRQRQRGDATARQRHGSVAAPLSSGSVVPATVETGRAMVSERTARAVVVPEPRRVDPSVARAVIVNDASAVARDVPRSHVVQRDETFASISQQYYGSARFANALWYVNRDLAPNVDKLYIGTELRIPAVHRAPAVAVARARAESEAAGVRTASLAPAAVVRDGDPALCRRNRPSHPLRRDRSCGWCRRSRNGVPRACGNGSASAHGPARTTGGSGRASLVVVAESDTTVPGRPGTRGFARSGLPARSPARTTRCGALRKSCWGHPRRATEIIDLNRGRAGRPATDHSRTSALPAQGCPAPEVDMPRGSAASKMLRGPGRPAASCRSCVPGDRNVSRADTLSS